MMAKSGTGTQGKYLKKTHKFRKRRKINPKTAGFLGILVVLLSISAVWMYGSWNRSIYQTIVSQGYAGTQEQWLASLVGETVNGETETAYVLAAANGYKGTEQEWNRTLTGTDSPSTYTNTYALACENGLDATLVEWLTDIADAPEKLGVSGNGDKKTEYELACEYGYSGTFIEWIVSVTYDRTYE